jgi:uncharacterized membrane protein
VVPDATIFRGIFVASGISVFVVSQFLRFPQFLNTLKIVRVLEAQNGFRQIHLGFSKAQTVNTHPYISTNVVLYRSLESSSYSFNPLVIAVIFLHQHDLSIHESPGKRT